MLRILQKIKKQQKRTFYNLNYNTMKFLKNISIAACFLAAVSLVSCSSDQKSEKSGDEAETTFQTDLTPDKDGKVSEEQLSKGLDELKELQKKVESGDTSVTAQYEELSKALENLKGQMDPKDLETLTTIMDASGDILKAAGKSLTGDDEGAAGAMLDAAGKAAGVALDNVDLSGDNDNDNENESNDD